jgi:hypothetical protein
MHFAKAVRLALVPVLADAAAGLDVVVWVLLELLALATTTTTITRIVASAARPSIIRRARGDLGLLKVILGVLSGRVDQPAVPVLVEFVLLAVLAGARVAPAPESLTDVALIAPLELFKPWITTASPGRTDVAETPSLLVILVAEESVTLTVLPELSVR